MFFGHALVSWPERRAMHSKIPTRLHSYVGFNLSRLGNAMWYLKVGHVATLVLRRFLPALGGFLQVFLQANIFSPGA